MSTLRIVGLLGIIGMFAGCAQMPPEQRASNAIAAVATPDMGTTADSGSDGTRLQSEAIASQPLSGVLQTGYASWYARKFQGRRTANGERYDSRSLTAAHRTLPLGTYVRVTSLTTARSVVVRINDRGPFVKGRIIDLSLAAAEALGLTRTSSMQVQIQRVNKAADTRVASDGSES
ncbi:septal ring lytic transglycosylase RlpA family protein [Paraburkholderia azotifigens]|uniref:Endolytic peptidoglycan transglycosylase RlpA n=1 Tax=Paraburkholderia azotifigens TaxID=2057004 RepID=A0ABU9RFQ2_9BURK|nr:septal ring lytic transglycosylase RlpA family protein [Paraburkholderia azotifigens]